MKGARPWRQSLRVKGLPKVLKLCAESGLSAGLVLVDWLPSVKFQGRDSTDQRVSFKEVEILGDLMRELELMFVL